MSYDNLIMLCYGQSIVLSLVFGILITVGIYKLTNYLGKQKPKVKIVAKAVETPKHHPNQDRLFTDLLCGKFDIK